MKLTVIERISLLGVLPTEGNFVTLKIVRQLREALSFTESEIKTLSIRQEGDQVMWNALAEAPGGAEIVIGEKATEIIAESLKKLDQQGKLTEQLISVYEKFVEV
jgi:hypothetical protein